MQRVNRTLAFAASTGRVAAVFLENDAVVGWRMSRKASKSPSTAVNCAKSWIDDYNPDLIISEDPGASNKGVHVKALLEAIGQVSDQADGLNIRLNRFHAFDDKYAEAKALAVQYPQIQRKLPKKPPIWMPEPHAISYFEALSYVAQLKT